MAVYQINNQNYSSAINYLNEAEKFEKRDSLYTLMSYCYLILNDFEKSLEKSNTALNINPKNDYGYFLRGYSKSMIPISSEEKNKIFNTSEKSDSLKYEKFKEKYTFIDNQVYNIKNAIIDLNKAIDLNPGEADYYNLRGNFFEELFQFQKALQDFDKAISLNPKNPDFFLDRSLLYQELKNYQKSLSDLDEAIKLDKDNPVLYANRGFLKIYHFDKKIDGCEDLFKATNLGWYIENYESLCN